MQQASYLFETQETYGKNDMTFVFYRRLTRRGAQYKVFTIGGKDAPQNWVEHRANQVLTKLGYN